MPNDPFHLPLMLGNSGRDHAPPILDAPILDAPILDAPILDTPVTDAEIEAF
jgi:hypothetical protein